jgi:hypothetical protein
MVNDTVLALWHMGQERRTTICNVALAAFP